MGDHRDSGRLAAAPRIIATVVIWTALVLLAIAGLVHNAVSQGTLRAFVALWVVGVLFGAFDAVTIADMMAALRRNEERYRQLFGKGRHPTFMLATEPSGRFGAVLEMNDAACELLRAKRETLVGMRAERLFVEMGPEVEKAVSESVAKRASAALQTTLTTIDGTTIPVEVEFSRFDSEGRSAILAHATDLREARAAERALRRRSRQLAVLSSATRRLNEELDMPTILEQLVNAAMEMVSATSAGAGLVEGDEIVLNTRAAKDDHPRTSTRLKRGEGIAGHVWETMAPYVSSDVPRDLHVRDLADRSVISIAAVPIIDRHDTFLGYLEVHDRADGRPFDDDDIVILTGLASSAAIAIDNTRGVDQLLEARSQLLADQKRLRSLAAELSSTSERERRVIAAELHDEIGQALAIARMKFGQAASQASLPPQILEARGLVEQAIAGARSLTFQISPPLLYELGLGAAIEWLAEETEEHHGLAMSCHVARLPENIPDDLRALLYVCTRELLVNVVKHARADSAEVSLGFVANRIRVIVIDDGCGFDTAASHQATATFGLFSVAERLGGFGGSLEVTSVPGEGTTAVIEVPFEETGIAEAS